MSAVMSEEAASGPGWMAILSPGRIQLRTSPEAHLYGVTLEVEALHALLPARVLDQWDMRPAYVDEMGWDVWIVSQVTTW